MSIILCFTRIVAHLVSSPRPILMGAAVVLSSLASIVEARQVSISIEPPIDSHGHAVFQIVDTPRTVWSFPNSRAGISELGKRIESLHGFDADGSEVPI